MAWQDIENNENAGNAFNKINKTGSDADWMLGTDNFISPVIVYGSGDVEVNSTGVIPLYKTGGTEPFISYAVTSGVLPSEFTLNTSTGELSYTTTSSQSSGVFTVTATNPVGTGSYEVSYDIKQANGIAQFTNSENKYPFLRISTSNSLDEQAFIKQTFHGRTTSTSNGTIIEDSAYPIYAASNGDGTWNYFIQPTGYSYWLLYVNRTTDPSTLANGVSTDLTTSAGEYDLVAPSSDDVTVNGVYYPSDQSDVHYGTSLNYISFGTDASLDNFMTDAGVWSYGFRLQEAWLPDGLGLSMFNRNGRNWLGIIYAHNSTYSQLIVGNGSSRTYDSSEVTSLPSNGFPAGSYVRVTKEASVLSFYVDGVKYYDYDVNSYMDGVGANSLELRFGASVESNAFQTNTSYQHGGWQGQFDRLWISNGVVELSDDDGATFPAGTTHSWLLDEITGKTFVANTGGVDGSGESAS